MGWARPRKTDSASLSRKREWERDDSGSEESGEPSRMRQVWPAEMARSPRALHVACFGVSCTAYSSRSPSLFTTMTLEVSGCGCVLAFGTSAKEARGWVKVLAGLEGVKKKN